jgi:hypothetical protein
MLKISMIMVYSITSSNRDNFEYNYILGPSRMVLKRLFVDINHVVTFASTARADSQFFFSLNDMFMNFPVVPFYDSLYFVSGEDKGKFSDVCLQLIFSFLNFRLYYTDMKARF